MKRTLFQSAMGGIARTMAATTSWFSHYAGANNYDRRRRQIVRNTSDSIKTLTPFVRTELMSRARYLRNNCGMVRGAIRDLSLYSIGGGLVPQAGTGDQGWNDAAEALFRERGKVIDLGGKFTLHQLAKLGSQAVDTDGDIGFIMASGDFPQIQAVEAHRIGDGGKGDSADGVVLDRAGRPVSYRILEGDDQKPRDIAARDFIHLFDPERVDQARGLTSLYHAVNTLQDIFEILGAETNAIKINSQIALIVENEDGEADPRGSPLHADTTNPSYVTQESEDGQIRHITAGMNEKITAHLSNRPSSTFEGYLDHIARDTAVGLGLPFEFIWDASKLGGATQRFILQKAQRRFDERQELFAVRFYTRIWGWVISKAIKQGQLPANPDWWKVRWQGPAKITVDVGREAQQNRADILMGLRTVSEDAAERSVDLMDLRRQQTVEVNDLVDRAQTTAKEKNISFELALALYRNPNGNGIASVSPQTDQPTTPPAP